MPANTNPIFTLSGDVQWTSAEATGANITRGGTGSPIYVVFTASAGGNGSYVQKLRFKSSTTNGTTVARIFINNGGATGTAGNNILFDEITLPSQTLSESAAASTFEVPMNMVLPASYSIFVTLGTAVTGGWYVSALGGKY